MRSVPVLMYHHVNPHKGDMVTVTPTTFERQMEYLSEAGYKTLTLDELLSYIKGDLVLQQKAVVVTFDDGWLDNYIYAFPVLKKYNIHASIFIVTNIIERASRDGGKPPTVVPTHRESKLIMQKGEEHEVFLRWDIIKEMAESELIGFFSHAKTHASCDFLSEPELSEELEASKHVIEERLKKPCPFLCWPFGRYTSFAIEVARKVGYSATYTTNHGIVTPGSDPFAIKRIGVKDDMGWFKSRMRIYSNLLLARIYLKLKRK